MKKTELMQLKRAEAKRMYEDEGVLKYHIAAALNISEYAVRSWVKKYNWIKKYTVLELKKMRANRMVLEGKHTPQQIADTVQISLKTVLRLYREYKLMLPKIDRMKKKKKEVKELFTRSELTQKQIAVQTGISERTISKWKEKYKWKRENSFFKRPLLAYDLITNKGYKQREAAKEIGVSERTMSVWKKKNFYRNL